MSLSQDWEAGRWAEGVSGTVRRERTNDVGTDPSRRMPEEKNGRYRGGSRTTVIQLLGQCRFQISCSKPDGGECDSCTEEFLRAIKKLDHCVAFVPVREVLSLIPCKAGNCGEDFFVSKKHFPTYGLRCGFRSCCFTTKVHSVSRTHLSKAESKLRLSLIPLDLKQFRICYFTTKLRSFLATLTY